MKTGRSLQEVMVELNRQEGAKRDYIAPSQGMVLYDDGRTFEMNHSGSGARELLGTSSLFHRQMGTALGIPAKYYDAMRSQKPELLAANVNAWLSDRDTSYMVRTMDYGEGPVARALLSERYRRIDNLQVAANVLPLFAGQSNYEVASCEVTESRMYFKIVNHTMQAEVKPGDIVEGGIVISNSEVGQGSVSVFPFLNRLICTNGMCVNDLGERKHHIGRQNKAVEDSFDLYSDATLEAEDKAFMLKLRDVCLAAIEQTRFLKVVDRLKESTGARITGAVPEVVELTSRNYGITQDEQDGILRYLIEGGDLSLYGLSNAVTRVSQDVESYDRATALEGIGWQVATMTPAQWASINGV